MVSLAPENTCKFAKLGTGRLRAGRWLVDFGFLPVIKRPASARHEIGTPNALASCKTLAAPKPSHCERPRGA